MKALTTLSMALLLALCAPAQDLGVKAAPQKMPVALVNGTIHTVSGETLRHGWIRFAKGRIVGLGEGQAIFTADTRVIDLKGKHVYPGLIGAYTHLGLEEISRIRQTTDLDEIGSINPEVRAAVAVNPDSTLIPVARSNGILTAGVFPRGGVVPGRASVCRLDGWTWEEMAVNADSGLVINWPRSRTIKAWWMNRSEKEQLEEIRKNNQRIEETILRAKAYLAAKRSDPLLRTDVRWEAMRSLFGTKGGKKRNPVFLLAQDYDQIVSAVSFAKKHGLRAVIVGGRDAPLCARLLRENDVSVVVLGTHRTPRRADSDYDEAFKLPLRLQQAGIRWCLASGEETGHERNLPYNAASAVAHGLPHDEAIRSVTLSAAEILGVGDHLGSLEESKLATLLVTDGSPLEITTKIHTAWIDGRAIDLGNKQTALRDKYREKYRQRRDR